MKLIKVKFPGECPYRELFHGDDLTGEFLFCNNPKLYHIPENMKTCEGRQDFPTYCPEDDAILFSKFLNPSFTSSCSYGCNGFCITQLFYWLF